MPKKLPFLSGVLPGTLPTHSEQRAQINPQINQEEIEKIYNEAAADAIYGTGGLYGNKITTEGLGPYMKKDPLYNVYDQTTNMDLIKNFAQNPFFEGLSREERINKLIKNEESLGYTYPYTHGYTHTKPSGDDIFIRDLNKFVNKPDVLNPNTMGNIYEQNKRIADVISHESRHQLMQEPKFAGIREKRDKLLGPAGVRSPEEVFNRFLDLKSNQLRGQLETKIDPMTGTQEVDWRNLKGDYRDYDYLDHKLRNTENIPMMGSSFAWQEKLDPLIKEFFKIAQHPSPYPWTGYTAPKVPIGGGYTMPKVPIGGGYTMPKRLNFKQQLKKQQMQKKIQQAEIVEANRQALQSQVTTQANKEARERVSRGEERDYGKTETRASSGWESSPFNRGGMVDKALSGRNRYI
jgi:hypothetical protein